MAGDTTSEHTLLKLRLLADAVVAALSGGDSANATGIPTGVQPEASEAILRAFLARALPMVRSTRHAYLALQIEALLDESKPYPSD